MYGINQLSISLSSSQLASSDSKLFELVNFTNWSTEHRRSKQTFTFKLWTLTGDETDSKRFCNESEPWSFSLSFASRLFAFQSGSLEVRFRLRTLELSCGGISNWLTDNWILHKIESLNNWKYYVQRSMKSVKLFEHSGNVLWCEDEEIVCRMLKER